MTRLLLVEDSEDVRETLAYLLTREGYTVQAVGDGPAALDAVARATPDVILLDVMLPGLTGIDVCHAIRETSDVPIIMLTAKVAEADIVVGLEAGADDYVTKPFSTAELLARLKSVQRRRPSADERLAVGGLKLDVERHRVQVDGQPVEMPPREFALLELLMRFPGRVLTRRQIIERVWGDDYFGDTKTLDVHVRRLRAKIERDPAHPVRLETVRGLGYRLTDGT